MTKQAPSQEGNARDPLVTHKRIDPISYGLPGGAIADPRTVKSAFAIAIDKGVNLLAAEAELSFIPEGYAVSLRMVMFDPHYPEAADNRSNGRWYRDPRTGLFCLHHVCLDQLAQIAAMRVTSSRRVDDGRTTRLWRFECAGNVRLFDGSTRSDVVNYELDAREGSDLLVGKTALQTAQIRLGGSRLAEAKCKNALIRTLLCVRQGYTLEEAERPFLWPALVWMPGNDADTRRMIAARELGCVEEVYGRGGERRDTALVTVEAEEAPRGASPGRGKVLPEPPPAEPSGDTCSRPGCGAVVTPELAKWCREHVGALLCRPHALEERTARAGGKA